MRPLKEPELSSQLTFSLSPSPPQNLQTLTVSPSQQLELFSRFFANRGPGGSDVTRLLGLYDILPKYLYSRNREVKGDTIREFSIRHRGFRVKVTVTAAQLKIGSRTVHIFPGEREELVEREIRYLCAQRVLDLIPVEKIGPNMRERGVSTVTNLYPIQKALETSGRNLNFTQIREALLVLDGCRLVLEISREEENTGDTLIYRGPIVAIQRELMRNSAGQKEVKAMELVLHPLASKSILGGDVYSIAHPWISSLGHGLSRIITHMLLLDFPNAKKLQLTDAEGQLPPAYELKLSDILQWGILPPAATSKQRHERAERVRVALRDCFVNGIIGDEKFPMSLNIDIRGNRSRYELTPEEIVNRRKLVEDCKFGESPVLSNSPDRGRREVLDVIWQVRPSNMLVEQIIRNHKDRKADSINA